METVHVVSDNLIDSEGALWDLSNPDAIIDQLTQKLDHLRYHNIPEKYDAILQLEKTMLDFYYQHEIFDEQCSENSPQQRIPHDHEVCNEIKSVGVNVETVTETSSAAASLPSYYQSSEWAQLMAQEHSFRKAFDKEYSTELRKVQQSEESVEKEIIQGTFAVKRNAVIQEEKTLKALEETLQEKKEASQRIQQLIHREEEIQLGLGKEQSSWEGKKRKLEELKQEQQNNVDGIRQGLRVAEEKLSRAKQQFQQRELTIQYLNKLIAERISQNKSQEQLKKKCST